MLQAVLDNTLVVLATKITTFYNALLEAYLFLNQISLQGTHFYLQHFYDLCYLAISKIHNIYSGMYRVSHDSTTLCMSMVTNFKPFPSVSVCPLSDVTNVHFFFQRLILYLAIASLFSSISYIMVWHICRLITDHWT